MKEWNGPHDVFDGSIKVGQSWTKEVEHRGVTCELEISIYDEEGTVPDLIIYDPDGFESYPCFLNSPSEEELRSWADKQWLDFVDGYDYCFDVWAEKS